MTQPKKDKESEKEQTKQEAIIEQIEIDQNLLTKKVEAVIESAEEKEIVKPLDEAKIEKVQEEISTWKPITEVGRKVKSGEITDLNFIFDHGLIIKEPQIVDALLSNPESDLLLIGQSKGKFGGGKRKAFKQTQKKTQEGNKPKFATYAIIGNKSGFIGIGYGKSKETVPAREKALRNAKTSLIRIKRGCGSWQCGCKTPHSIPFEVQGKAGSTQIILMPAPKGTGLKIEKECQKILRLAGIKDIWSKTFGQTGSKINLVKACEMALKNLSKTKSQEKFNESLGIMTGNRLKE